MNAKLIVPFVIVFAEVGCFDENSSVLILNLTSSSFLSPRQNQIFPAVNEDRIKFVLYTSSSNHNITITSIVGIFAPLQKLNCAWFSAKLKFVRFVGKLNLVEEIITHLSFGRIFESKDYFLHFSRKHPNGYRLIRNNYKNLLTSSFNSTYPTKVIIHGYINNYISSAIQLPKNAYLSNGKYNVIAVDWGEYAFPYLVAASSVKPIGHLTGSMISFLINRGGLKLSDLHFIGHSLGAHVAGYAVDRIGFKPSRITGLDPAAPIFSEYPSSDRLGAEDAEFVDVIHTSVRVLGMTQNIGHADFYPAGGKHQPRCSSDIVEEVIGSCDHGQSYIYFSESIRNKNNFPAVKCRSLPEALDKKCKGKISAIMGDSAGYRKPRGIFYVDENVLGKSRKVSYYLPVVRTTRKKPIFDFKIF